ncbi:hypothetical protein [Intestinibacter sp.]
MRAKPGKKNSKNKEVENNTTIQYEEKYNDVILNDLVPEERKEEFNTPESENKPRKKMKKNGLKFNIGKKSKKNNKHKQVQEPQQEAVNKSNKSKKNNEEIEETNQPIEQKKSKKTRPRQHHKKHEQHAKNENQEATETTTNKAGHKHTKKRIQKHRKQVQDKAEGETVNIQEIEEVTPEDSQQIDESENMTYRGEKVEKEVQENIGVEDKNIIWSDENFDK